MIDINQRLWYNFVLLYAYTKVIRKDWFTMPSNDNIYRRRAAQRRAALRRQRQFLILVSVLFVTVLVVLIVCAVVLLQPRDKDQQPTPSTNPTMHSSSDSGKPTRQPTSGTTVPSTSSGPKDTQRPVIDINPTANLSVYLGDSIAYKSFIIFSDDQATEAELSKSLKVDRSDVDTSAPGVYPVTYTVTDNAGNKASLTIQLTIMEKPSGYVEPDVAYNLARNVLAQITTEDMSKAEVAAAIYNYVKFNISYSGSSDKNRGWPAGAVDGFTRGTGDCYTYYATAKALYDVAGIPNVDVVKVKTPQTSQSSHYWSLIDVGNGWYHVDCTPRANNYADSFFLYTDEEMLAYSRNNHNCFNFDPAAYPARQTESVQSHIQFSSSTLKVTIKESW